MGLCPGVVSEKPQEFEARQKVPALQEQRPRSGAPAQGRGPARHSPGGLIPALGLWDQGLQEDRAWLCMRDNVHAGLEMALKTSLTFDPFCRESLLVTSSSYGHGPSGMGQMIRILVPGNRLRAPCPLRVCPGGAWGQTHLNARLGQGSQGQGLGAVVFTAAI